MAKNYLLRIVYLLFLLSQQLYAQVDLSYFLPQDISYNPQIPTPNSVLGFEVGEWHASHDQLLYYFRTLDAASDRITLQEYARTYEKRPLILLTVTSPENHRNIDRLREEHLHLSNPAQSSSLDIQNMPLVVNLGYSIHGNEASGANASMLVAYYLAAAQGEKIENLLKNTIILMDPSLNPDGLQRFSTWVNMHKSEHLSSDPNSRELNEVFPGGRTNHYWFDLNRDWLLLQHPESRGRIEQFHRWRPNILTDHHEMGSNSTFFFQPGIPSSTNPLTPPENQQLTEEIGKYHAKALDEISSAYFTKEIFDDFYYGKGSTYPDVQGGVGILFEQASARGHARATVNGLLTFPFAIRNHFTVSLSTLAAAQDMRIKLLQYQRDFFKTAPKEKGAYVFGSEFDPARNYHLLDILRRHQIEVRSLKKDLKAENLTFKAGKAFVVSLDQIQVRLIKAIFQTQIQYQDSVFYDISTWTLPLAFNLPYSKLGFVPDSEVLNEWNFPQGKAPLKASKVGYVFLWDTYYAPRALNRIQQKGLLVKVATQQSNLETEDGTLKLDFGTILIPSGNQKLSSEEIFALMNQIAKEDGVEVYALKSGLAKEGVDLGSAYFQELQKPQVLLLGGEGTSAYEVGEAWHLFDQRYRMSVSLADIGRFEALDLNRYNTLILAGGNYNALNGRGIDKIKNCLNQGNVLISTSEASLWVNNAGLNPIKLKNQTPIDSAYTLAYAQKDRLRGAQEIGGVILEAQLDITHPLGYGFKQSKVPFFKTTAQFAEISKDPYATPLYYSKNALVSGYISSGNLKLLENTAAILVGHYGKGKVISFMDDPNFRAFWYGTNKLFANAVFFGRNIER